MKTEGNEKIIHNKMNSNMNAYFLKDDFVKIINSLADSIKEYFKVSNCSSKCKTMLVKAIEEELKAPESIFNINNVAYNNVQSYNEISRKINENFKKLKENVNSEEINLKKFFEDAKIQFKKMRDYRQHYIQNNSRKQKSLLDINTKKNNDMCPDINQKINTTQNQNQIPNQKSEIKNKIYSLTNRNEAYNNTVKPNTRAFNNILLKSDGDSDGNQNLQNELSKDKDSIISSLKLQLNKIKQKFIKEIDVLNKQILMLKKQLSDEQFKNQELKKENNMLKNKHELELSQLSKRNTELSKTLMNNQNELLNLQKEILDKTKEIEILKKSSINSMNSKMIFESFITVLDKENSTRNSMNKPWNNLNESLNRILENYKNENQQLKIDFHEKIQYYQEQLKNAKNELLEKIQINMENESKREKQINEIKNDYDKKMEEVNNKNRIIDNYINLCQEANNNLMNRITQINQKVSAKEMKIVQLEEENQELNEKIKELYNLKGSNNLNDIDLKLKEENINLNKKLEEQNQINEKLKEELKMISNEHDTYHRRLLSLGIKYIGEHESSITRDEGFEILNDQIKQLKQQNETLKDMIETLIKDFLGKYKEKKEENEKYDDEKGKLKEQYDIIEKLKQVTFKVINGQGNNTDEVNSLKKENEKLIDQILKLTDENARMQKEQGELQKQYYKIKNEKKGAIANINNTSNDEILKELKKVKKENEEIKKKNDELISKLEEKEIKQNFDNRSEDGNRSNYEEEFDLRKMAKGAKDKNRSQDNNIDYPGIQMYKEKYRDLDFKYSSMEALIKSLLLNVQVGPKNKNYVNQLCKLVGFDLETTNKILNNKNNKKVLGLFQK
jgi:hypothetical protein